MTRFFSAVPLLAGLAAVLAQPAAAQMFNPKLFTLANGLQVIVVERPGAAAVQQMLVYKAGSADEPAGKSGIAHYLEHLMFKGTPQTPPGVFDREAARFGGRQNAYTIFDQTAYHQTVPVSQLAEMMRLEADRMKGLALSEANSRPELDVVLQERRQRTDTPPSGRLSEQANAVMYVHSPYGTPVIGWEEEIRGLTWQDAVAFHQRWYAPNNAVLIVDGGVSADEVKRLADGTYGLLPARTVPARLRAAEPPKVAEVRLEQQHPAVRDASFTRRWLAPSLGEAFTGPDSARQERLTEAYALQVLGEILGGGARSRLHGALVLEQGLASSAAAGYDPLRLGVSGFTVWATPARGVDPQKLEAAVAAEIDRLLKDGVTAAEVAGAIRRLEASTAYSLDGIGTAGRVFAAAVAAEIPVAEVEAWPQRIRAVTAEQVTAAARRILSRPTVVTWLKPREQA
jgi:zinc protease